MARKKRTKRKRSRARLDRRTDDSPQCEVWGGGFHAALLTGLVNQNNYQTVQGVKAKPYSDSDLARFP